MSDTKLTRLNVLAYLRNLRKANEELPTVKSTEITEALIRPPLKDAHYRRVEQPPPCGGGGSLHKPGRSCLACRGDQ